MAELQKISKTEIKNWEKNLLQKLDLYKESGLKLDLTRGKPGTDQLDLSD